MDSESIRIIGGLYRRLVDVAPDRFSKGHAARAAQRPLIGLMDAQHIAQEYGSITPSLQRDIAIISESLPTEATKDVLYADQQAVFMMGYNACATVREEDTGLLAMRTRRRMTQIRLAELSGVSRMTIGNIEAGRYMPTVTTLKKLSSVLHCKMEDLI